MCFCAFVLLRTHFAGSLPREREAAWGQKLITILWLALGRKDRGLFLHRRLRDKEAKSDRGCNCLFCGATRCSPENYIAPIKWKSLSGVFIICRNTFLFCFTISSQKKIYLTSAACLDNLFKFRLVLPVRREGW